MSGMHYCLPHQGDHSHYDPANCYLCRSRRALEAVLLFHAPDWRAEEQRKWEQLTGTKEATTRSLCDFVRLTLGQAERFWPAKLEPGAK